MTEQQPEPNRRRGIQAAYAADEVSTSACDDWLARLAGPPEAEWDEARLVNEFNEVHDHLDDTDGGPRMTDDLRSRGHCVNHTGRTAPSGQGSVRHRRPALQGEHDHPDVCAPPLPNLVGRDFNTANPDSGSCADITYIPTDEGWLYVANVLDLDSRGSSAMPWPNTFGPNSARAPSRWPRRPAAETWSGCSSTAGTTAAVLCDAQARACESLPLRQPRRGRRGSLPGSTATTCTGVIRRSPA